MPTGAPPIPLIRGISQPVWFADTPLARGRRETPSLAPSARLHVETSLTRDSRTLPLTMIGEMTMNIHELGSVLEQTKLTGPNPGDNNLGEPV